ncbi:hypothetical protein F66182_5528 [Fusarium sp. NRRL 66182]|nr:hypothetical protein F66182_5528 [Fusarium sp. NRRL 66182]
MDLDTGRRTPSPVPSLGHDFLNTPITEMPTPPVFASTFSLPITTMNLSIEAPNFPSGSKLEGKHLPPSLPQTETCIDRLDMSINGGTPDFILLYCFNIERAVKFYTRCFGWKFHGDMNSQQSADLHLRQWGSSRFDAQPMSFFTNRHDESRIAGALIQIRDTEDSSAQLERKKKLAMASNATPTSHIRVPDFGLAEGLIEDNSGKIKYLRFGVRQCAMDIGEFVDTEGNLIGLVSMHPEHFQA